MTRPFSDSPSSELVEILVHDVPEPCPYIPGMTARMPLRLQFERDPDRLDKLLAEGDRRVGPLMYKTVCPSCNACEPLRVPLDDFKFSKSQRRIWNQNQDLRLEISTPPPSDRERVNLFNRHRLERNLSKKRLGAEGYHAWLSQSWTQSYEFAWFMEDQLILASIMDVGRVSSSAVYCYFEPAESKRSLGTYAILHGIRWGQERGLKHHYLGLHVEQNPHLSYKAKYRPHERRINEEWKLFT